MSRVINPSCENCKHCRPIKDCNLIGKCLHNIVFYCDHFEGIYCETTPCTTGYKKRRVKK